MSPQTWAQRKTSGINAEYLRSLRLLAAEKLLCTQCRARPARPGLRSCTVCSDRSAALKVAFRKAGRCACGKKRQRARKQCPTCIAGKARQREVKHHAKPLTDMQRHVLAQLATFADERYRFPREVFEMVLGSKVPGALCALVRRGLVERIALPVARDPNAYRITPAGRASVVDAAASGAPGAHGAHGAPA